MENSPDTDDMGAIKVADEVLSIVAGLAASEVTGVYGMSGGIREGLTDMLGKQNFSKGIKVYTEGHTVRVEVHVIITYGFNIPDVAIKLQEKVKEAVEKHDRLRSHRRGYPCGRGQEEKEKISATRIIRMN